MGMPTYSHGSALPSSFLASSIMAQATALSPCLPPVLSFVRCSGTRATPLTTRRLRKSESMPASFGRISVLSSIPALRMGMVSRYQASEIMTSRTCAGPYSWRAASASAEPFPRASSETPEKRGRASRMAKRICCCVRCGQLRSSRTNGGTRRRSLSSVAGQNTDKSPLRPKSTPQKCARSSGSSSSREARFSSIQPLMYVSATGRGQSTKFSAGGVQVSTGTDCMHASIMVAVRYAPLERFGIQKSSSSAPSP